MRLRYIQRDDVRERSIAFTQNEPSDIRVFHGQQTLS
jgi:hypothetical protein